MAGDRTADWLGAADALRRILDAVAPLGVEERALLDARGGVIAEDVVAPLDLPPWDNSAMDGFAVRACDVLGAAPGTPCALTVVGELPAGALPSRAVGAGEAIRIMTGAPVPPGADTVVRVEHTDAGAAVGGTVVVRSDADAGRNVRPRGEDVRAGEVVLPAGTVMRPGALAVAASVGRATLRVVRRPRVAILASGDELVGVESFDEVRAGRRIVSSNSYALAALLADCGMEARPLGIAADTPASLAEHLARADGCDAIVTTAGISVGDHDHVLAAMEALRTEIAFWRVRIRPGSALAFGRVAGLGGIPWFGLPGNPVSTQVTFELFVRPALLRMAGLRRIHVRTVEARLADGIDARGSLLQLPRVRLLEDEGDVPVARLTGDQGSGIASSMASADGIAIVPAGRPLAPGDAVRVALLGGAPLTERGPFPEA